MELVRRVNFRTGMHLTADDLRAEQDYPEEPDGRTPSVEGETFGRWLERPLLGVSAAGQLPAGAPPEALVLARLRVAGGSVVGVDHDARSTWTPAR